MTRISDERLRFEEAQQWERVTYAMMTALYRETPGTDSYEQLRTDIVDRLASHGAGDVVARFEGLLRQEQE